MPRSLIIPKFYDFKKEVKDILPHLKSSIDASPTATHSPIAESASVLEARILSERDYDFYDDDPGDAKGAESSENILKAMDRNSEDYEYDAEQRDYGHSSGGHSEHESGYGEHDSGYKVPTKKPGPYGYATPNFKCEKSSETLYVTETEWTYDTKCYNVYKVQCTEGYDEGKVCQPF